MTPAEIYVWTSILLGAGVQVLIVVLGTRELWRLLRRLFRRR